ncbi:MAG: hypothetical protein J6S72_09745, partial [Lachnospiraceae bacterium]|nr:hypothetical protein [Lachnospiraceae bacterium]
ARTDAAPFAPKASGTTEEFFSPTRSAETGKTVPVKKPNGAKPGFVVYYTNYSMVAVPGTGGLIQEEQ